MVKRPKNFLVLLAIIGSTPRQKHWQVCGQVFACSSERSLFSIGLFAKKSHPNHSLFLGSSMYSPCALFSLFSTEGNQDLQWLLMQNILKSYKHIMEFLKGENKNKQKLHFDASKTIFLEKWKEIDSILFKCHFVFQEKITLPRECTNKEKGLTWEGQKQKPKQTNTFLCELFNSYYFSLTDYKTLCIIWITCKTGIKSSTSPEDSLKQCSSLLNSKYLLLRVSSNVLEILKQVAGSELLEGADNQTLSLKSQQLKEFYLKGCTTLSLPTPQHIP